MSQVVVATSGPEETQEIGRLLAPLLRRGDVLVLSGDLGAGKTCLSQGIGQGLGVEARITSPTFALANQYRTTRIAEGGGINPPIVLLHHLDVYRLDSVIDSLDLDLPELEETGITLIEWGERIAWALASDYLLVSLCYPDIASDDGSFAGDDGSFAGDELRLLRFSASGPGWDARLADLRAVVGPWLIEGIRS